MDTPDSSQGSGLIDFSFLRIYSGSNNELMKKFIHSFLEKTPETIKRMEEQLASQDFHALSRTAHSLKPQLSYVGIIKAPALIKTIEESAHEVREVELLPMRIDELKSLLNKAYKELQHQLNLL